MPSLQTNPTSDKSERILDAARDLFAVRGFYGTAVPLIAKAAGVGAGTIYRYFESKEKLVNVLYRREKQAITSCVMADFPATLSPRAQFHHFFARITVYAREHSASFQFLEHHHHAAYLDEESQALESRAVAMALAFLAQTSQAQITKPVAPQVIMAVIWGAIVHLMKESFVGVDLTQEMLDQAENMCWEAVRL